MADVLEVVEVAADDLRLIEAVVEVADRNRRTLGLMPHGVFGEFAARGQLLAAVDGEGALAGYALFEVARRRVRLVHLCVEANRRGDGIAKKLVRAISERHADLSGIALKCRRDYAASAVWPSLGFQAMNETAGRGRAREPLVHWWLSHGVQDLFSSALDDELLVVAIDHNVFIDLAIDPERHGAAESQALLADWLQEQVHLVVTHETPNEINTIRDPQVRRSHRDALGRFGELSYGPKDEERAQFMLDQRVGPTSQRDSADRRHIVSAAAGEARVFVTRDEGLIERFAAAAMDVFGLRVLRPAELILQLDEVANATNYRPAELHGTDLKVRSYGVDAQPLLDQFLDHSGGERKRVFHARLRAVAIDLCASSLLIEQPNGQPLAVWAVSAESDSRTLDVPLLRINERAALGATLGRLIIFQLKQDARERGRSWIRISDPHTSRALRSALAADGFAVDDQSKTHTCAVVEGRTRAQVMEAIETEQPLGTDMREVVMEASDLAQIADLERKLWPAKFLDCGIPNYVVSIRRRWADELLGLNGTLWGRPDVLGVSREHVYYHTPRGNPPVPARIAWYASGTGKRGIGAVVAVSRLIGVDTDTPTRLFRRYQHLGAYQFKDVQGSSRGGKASALRFVDTEILSKPVPWERLVQLSEGYSLGTLQSPTAIDSSVFGAIYSEGTGRHVK